jgi:hypothetical protein
MRMRAGVRARRLSFCVVTAAALCALVACSSGGGGSKTQSGTPGAAGSATPAGTSTPIAQATIEGDSFIFPARGYAATIPDGWHANPNSLLAGPQTLDTFFSNDTVEGVQSNISVTCEDNQTHIGTDAFVQKRTVTLTSLGATDIQPLAPPTIAGVPAVEVTYTLQRNTLTIRKIDAMFAAQMCLWTLASASAPSVASDTADRFAQFIKSFQLLGGAAATPQSGG